MEATSTMKTQQEITKFATHSDEELIRLHRAGNLQALSGLYNRYYHKVFQSCYRFTKDPETAFDLAQESLMKAFDHLDRFRQDSSFSTWLFAITRHHCLSVLKKIRHTGTVHSNDRMPEVIEEDTDANARAEQEHIMYTLIERLPQAERDLLHQKYREGTSIDALVAQTGLQPSAIKMRLKRTKEKLNTWYVLAMTYGMEQVLETFNWPV